MVTASVEDNEENSASDDDDATVTVTSLVIDKSVTNATKDRGSKDDAVIGYPGDKLSYTLAYTMTNGPLHGVVITDVLPEGLGTPSNISDGGVYDATTRTLRWELGTVEADGVVTYDVILAVGRGHVRAAASERGDHRFRRDPASHRPCRHARRAAG